MTATQLYLQSDFTYPCQPTTGEGIKRAFARLRSNVLPRSHTAVTDTPASPQTRGVTLLRTSGVGELFDPVYNLSSGMTAKMSISKSM